MNNTKAKYKEYVRGLDESAKEKELTDLSLALMVAKNAISRKVNPYMGGLPTKLLRWKIAYLKTVMRDG
jgi:hypothetical protein